MDSGYTFQKTDEEFIIQLKEWTGDKTITLNQITDSVINTAE